MSGVRGAAAFGKNEPRVAHQVLQTNKTTAAISRPVAALSCSSRTTYYAAFRAKLQYVVLRCNTRLRPNGCFDWESGCRRALRFAMAIAVWPGDVRCSDRGNKAWMGRWAGFPERRSRCRRKPARTEQAVGRGMHSSAFVRARLVVQPTRFDADRVPNFAPQLPIERSTEAHARWECRRAAGAPV